MCDKLSSGRRFHLEINWMLNRNITNGSRATATEDGGGGIGLMSISSFMEAAENG